MNSTIEDFAFTNQTVPRFVYQNPNGEYHNFEYELLTAPQAINPRDFYDGANRNALQALDLTIDEIVLPLVLANQAFIGLIRNTQENFFILKEILKLDEDTEKAVASLWQDIKNQKEYEGIIQSINQEKENFREQYIQARAQREMYKKTLPFVQTKTVKESFSNVYVFNYQATLLKLFDLTILSEHLPLVTTSNYYKVLKEFPYAIESPEDDLTMFLFIKGIRIVVYFNGSYVSPEYKVTIPSEDKFAREYIQKLYGIRDFKLIEKRTNLKVMLRSPKDVPFDFNRSVWADLIMNNNIISNTLVIDEHVKASKLSSDIYMAWITEKEIVDAPLGTVPFEPQTEKTVFYISEDSEYDVESAVYFKSVRVKIFGVRSDDEGNTLIEDLSRALGLYISLAKSIANFYNQILSIKIRIVPKIHKVDKVRLKNIAGEMFLPKHTRGCQFLPTVVSADESKELERQGYHIMQFPKIKEEGRQFYFSCIQHEEHIFPGLRVNKLINKDKFPLLPCCFRVDQKTKKSKYREYYEGLTATTDGEGIQKYILTDKILKFGQTGKLPDQIKLLFEALGEYDVVRQSAGFSSSSILNCIFQEIRTPFVNLKEVARTRYISNARANLSRVRDSVLYISKQECWNYSLKQMREILADQDTHLDVSLFYSLIELVYDCRLVIFGKKDFVHPKYLSAWLRYETSSRIIIVYENYGGEAEHAEYPQYELLMASDSIKEQVYQLYINSFGAQFVNYSGVVEPLFCRLASPSELVAQNIMTVTNIGAQHLDSYGKLSALNVNIKGIGGWITFVLEYPCAPLAVEISAVIYPSPKKLEGRLYSLILPISSQKYIIRAHTISKDKIFGSSSKMVEFIRLRKQSLLLVENAKHLNSQGKGEQIYLGSWKELDNNKWEKCLALDSKEEIGRLGFIIDLFRKRHPLEFKNYSKYTVLPQSYNNVSDFQAHGNTVVSNTLYLVEWTDVTNIPEKSPKKGAKFFIEISDQMYLCEPTPKFNTARTIIYLWNTREILSLSNLVIGALKVLVYEEDQELHFFQMNLVSANP